VLYILKFFPYGTGIPDHNYGSAPSILVQNQYNKPSQGASNVDTNTLVKATVNDMTSAEKGGPVVVVIVRPLPRQTCIPRFRGPQHGGDQIPILRISEERDGGSVQAESTDDVATGGHEDQSVAKTPRRTPSTC
jgi:hypothetical protein